MVSKVAKDVNCLDLSRGTVPSRVLVVKQYEQAGTIARGPRGRALSSRTSLKGRRIFLSHFEIQVVPCWMNPH